MASISEVKEETLRQDVSPSAKLNSGKSGIIKTLRDREEDELIKNNPTPFVPKL